MKNELKDECQFDLIKKLLIKDPKWVFVLVRDLKPGPLTYMATIKRLY